VHVDGFWLDCLEVTNAGFREFVQKTGYRANAEVASRGSLWRNRQWNGVDGLDWRHCGACDLAGNVWERDND
jgi:formylglycine-generating enzyme required for sulfatase activity